MVGFWEICKRTVRGFFEFNIHSMVFVLSSSSRSLTQDALSRRREWLCYRNQDLYLNFVGSDLQLWLRIDERDHSGEEVGVEAKPPWFRCRRRPDGVDGSGSGQTSLGHGWESMKETAIGRKRVWGKANRGGVVAEGGRMEEINPGRVKWVAAIFFFPI